MTQLIRHWQTLPHLSLPPSVVTIGNFDGVHAGHQVILQRVLDISRQKNLASVVMYFEPQPQEFFQGKNAPARLMDWRDKFEVLRDLGIDYVLVIRFDAAFRGLTAQKFIEQVLQPLNCQHLVVGDDFRFGCDRSGDFAFLQQQAFVVENTPTVAKDCLRISSTRIRQAIQESDFDLAAQLLGRPYMIAGHIKHGDKIGRTLDFPTANVGLNRHVSPVAGVYAVKIWGLADKPLLGAANVGTRPAVGGKENRIEVHILDFNGDIYGRRIGVQFCHKLRNETNFPSLDALKQAIANDVLATRNYFDPYSKGEEVSS